MPFCERSDSLPALFLKSGSSMTGAGTSANSTGFPANGAGGPRQRQPKQNTALPVQGRTSFRSSPLAADAARIVRLASALRQTSPL